MMPRPSRFQSPVLGALALAALSGCATRTADAPDAPPAEPLVRPADVAHASVSRAVFALQPVGVVPFSGPMLPLASPSGRFLAVPQGAPVPWPAVLAEPGAATDSASRIRVYSIKPGAADELPWSASLPRGLVLGRSCNEHGFLVEAPQSSGARWIGSVAWSDGRIEWLVRDDALNAHAAFGPGDTLVFTSRPLAGGPADIIVLRPGEQPARTPPPADASFFAPWSLGDHLAALLLSPGRIELVTLNESGSAPAAIVGRRTLAGASPTSGLAFQIIASQQVSPEFAPTDHAVYDPSTRGMIPVGDTARSSPLDRASIAAVRTREHPGDGWLVTTSDGLVFRTLASLEADRPDRVRISDVAFLPRLTTEPGRFMLLGPNPGGVAPSLQILMLSTLPSPPESPRTPQSGEGL